MSILKKYCCTYTNCKVFETLLTLFITCYPFLCFAHEVTLVIEVWDRQNRNNQEIDAVNWSILLLETDQQQMFQETGQNGIGVFNFSYHVLNLANKYEESFTQVPPLDNCTCDSESMIIESTTSPWSWIAVAILFMLLTVLFVMA